MEKVFRVSVDCRFSKKANAIIGYIKINLEVRIKDVIVWFQFVMIRPSKLCSFQDTTLKGLKQIRKYPRQIMVVMILEAIVSEE